MLHYSNFLPIMLKLFSSFIPLFPINVQLWGHNKWLKHILALQNACDRKHRYTLTELIVLLELLTVLLEYIDFIL